MINPGKGPFTDEIEEFVHVRVRPESELEQWRCPGCGQIPALVWTGGSEPEPSHEVCGCDD